MKPIAESMMGAVGEVEVAVGVSPGFFIRLAANDQDDWSFVIKLHALVEAALTHLLSVASANPGLEKVFGLLETSDTRKGKIAFVREMNLLEDNFRRYIVALSQVRNKFVHDVKNVGNTLDQYISSLDSNQRANFSRDLSLYDRAMEIGEKKVPLKQFVLENPKYGLWLGAMDLLANIYLRKEQVLLERDHMRFAKELAEAIGERAVAPPSVGTLSSDTGRDTA